MNNTILRAAIVGCGGIANNKHLPALVKQKNLKIIAFCDIVEERAVKARAKFGIYNHRLPQGYRGQGR